MYVPCRHLAEQGCGIYGQPERPQVCAGFRCLHVVAQEARAPDRHAIPHPADCGAYLARDPLSKRIAVFVDPARPERWKATALPAYLRPFLRSGFAVEIYDRGRRMEIASAPLFEEVLRMDYVAFAEREGRPLDFPSYRDAHPAPATGA